MKKTPILAAALGSVLLVAGLAACTVDVSDDPATPTPEASAASTQDQLQAEQQDPTGACIDGQAVVAATDETVSFPEGCATVSILGTGATIELGPVEHLVIENDGNTVTAESVAQIDSIGHDNTVAYGGDAEAQVTDHGHDNTFTKQ